MPYQISRITLVTPRSRFHRPLLGSHQPRLEAFVHGHLGFLGLLKSLVEPILYSVDLLDSGVAEVFEEQILSPLPPLPPISLVALWSWCAGLTGSTL